MDAILVFDIGKTNKKWLLFNQHYEVIAEHSIRIPELNEQRRKELVKVAHKYAEESRIAVRHVRRDGLDLLKKLEKDGKMSEDDAARQSDQVQKATDQTIVEIDQALSAKEKEIMQV